MSMSSSTREKIKQVYINALRLSNIDMSRFENNNLIEEFDITSVDSLAILIGIESEFNITISDEDLNQNLIRSITHVEEFLAKQFLSANI